jgi:hypothetical protein
MQSLLSPKNFLIAALGAAVVGLGTVVAIDHTAGAAASTQAASLSSSTTNATPRFGAGDLAGVTQLKNEASELFDFVTKDTKLSWQQIGAELLRGETLGQIAGPNATKLAADALAEVTAGLDKGVTKGAITSAEEARLVSDARDAISVLMAAKLSALAPSGH